MKSRLTIFSLLFFIIVNAQETESSRKPIRNEKDVIICSLDLSKLTNRTVGVTVNRVAEMAIYPGCEEFKGDKRNLVRCFAKKLDKDIEKYAKPKFPKNIYKKYVGARVEFNINTNGEIISVKPRHGDVEFRAEAKRVIEKVAERLKKNKQKIIPAKYDDGDDAILIFTHSIKLDNPNYNYVYDIVSAYKKENRSINEILDTLNSGDFKKYTKKDVEEIIKNLK